MEAKVLADINGTSGIQTQAYATIGADDAAQGLTKLETPATPLARSCYTRCDWEGVELALSSERGRAS